VANIYCGNIIPFISFAQQTNETYYLIKDLEPNSGYQFRVIAVKMDKSSPFSNWSDIINTTSKCKFETSVYYGHQVQYARACD
jgi:hypothetical protein